MTVFYHPNYKGKGVRNQLIGELLKRLQKTKYVSSEVSYKNNLVEFTI